MGWDGLEWGGVGWVELGWVELGWDGVGWDGDGVGGGQDGVPGQHPGAVLSHCWLGGKNCGAHMCLGFPISQRV